MADVLIRGIDRQSLRRLKERAKRNGRSLQGEAKLILEQHAGGGTDDVKRIFERWKARFAGRRFSTSAGILREDRAR